MEGCVCWNVLPGSLSLLWSNSEILCVSERERENLSPLLQVTANFGPKFKYPPYNTTYTPVSRHDIIVHYIIVL